MRFILFLFITLFLHTEISAQNIDSTKVPFTIRHKFDSIYPTLKGPAWQFNADSLYVASIFMEGLSKKVYFSMGGHLKRVITDMPISKVPQYLRDSLDHKYNKNYQLLSLTADVKYATMAYRNAQTQQLENFEDFKLLDYTIKISSDGKILTLNYNYNSHELMEE